jgi:miniconductance mechanosensitive channel
MNFIGYDITNLSYAIIISLLGFLFYSFFKRYILKTLKDINKNENSDIDKKWVKVFIEEHVFYYLNYLTPVPFFYAISYLFFSQREYIEEVILIYSATILTFTIEKILSAVYKLYDELDIPKKKPIKSFIQVGKFLSYSIGILFVLSLIFNKSIITFLSGLGALTAVLLIVFKDSLLSFKAGIQLIYNDMLRIDDWVEIPKFNADGEVIEIALDTIKVRNWDKTITFIPTYKLMEDAFINWRGMIETGSRRISRSILIDQRSIRFINQEDIDRFKKVHLLEEYMKEKEKEVGDYNKEHKINDIDPINGRKLTNIGTFRIYILNFIKSYPNINQDLPIVVRQMDPSVNGLPMEIYAFVNYTDFTNYEITQSDIFDHVLAVLPQFDLKICQIGSLDLKVD